MRDIVQDAVDNTQDETERQASGEVDGHEVRLEKKEYQVEQRGPTSWMVAVYVDGEDYPTEKTKELEPDEAETHFQKLKDKHGLT